MRSIPSASFAPTPDRRRYDLDAFANDMLVMVALGIAYRVVAYVFMVTAHRDKQK